MRDGGAGDRRDPQAPSAATGPRVAALDGLRAVAVVVVMLFHVAYPLMRGGGIGVDVFFVLSGFVITRLLLRERARTGRVDHLTFYGQRLLRLLPALAAACALVAVATAWGSPWGTQWRQSLVALCYVTDLENAAAPDQRWPSPLLGHTWSLSVEEQFYLVWPLLLAGLLALRRRVPRVALVLAGVLCLGPLAERAVLWHGYAASWNRVWNAPDTRADQLLLGCALALLLERGPTRALERARGAARWGLWPAVAALALVAVALSIGDLPAAAARGYYTVGFSAVAVAAAVVVAGLVLLPAHPVTRLLSWPPLTWTGRNLSYGLYLWHVPVLAVMYRYHLPASGLWELAVAALAALASFWWVESPVNRWRLRRGALVQAAAVHR